MSGPAGADDRTAQVPLRVTQLRVARSEWTKFRSLRSTLWTMTMSVALLIGLGAMFSAIAVGSTTGMDPGNTPISTSLTGTFFAQLAVGVLGALMITGEYATGMIRASLAVVPKRLPVLWAKLAVLAVVVFTAMLVASLTAFLLGQAILSSEGLGVSLSDPVARRSVLGAALYLAVAAVTAAGIGALLRNTAATITTFVAIFFLVPTLVGTIVPRDWAAHFAQYLPSNAGTGLIDGTYGLQNPLAPWPGFAVMCTFAAVVVLAAAWRLQRADA
jgi:hypothetical protein